MGDKGGGGMRVRSLGDQEAKKVKRIKGLAQPKCLDYMGKNIWGKAAQPPGWRVQGKGAGYASHTLEQVGSERCWEKLAVRVCFDMLNRHLI